MIFLTESLPLGFLEKADKIDGVVTQLIGLELSDELSIHQYAFHGFIQTDEPTTQLENMSRKMFLKLFEVGVSVVLKRSPTISEPQTFPNDYHYDHGFPAEYALQKRSLFHLKILYETGVMSNRMVSQLCDKMAKEQQASDEALKAEMVQDYLTCLSTSPRSLVSYCTIAVSDAIGCGPDRKSRALALSIPMSMIRKVLFYDILYP